jgi:hypothetical protein
MPQETILLQVASHGDTPAECRRVVRDQRSITELLVGHFYRYHLKRYCIHARNNAVWYEVPCTFPTIKAYEEARTKS